MKLALIGVGLIGGSFALAVRAAGKFDHIVGFDSGPEAMRRALELGVIDEAARSVANAVNDAQLVMVAIPVGSIRGVLSEIAANISSTAIVSDVGSVKGSVVEDARCELGESFARFVPGHPIAGREHSGVEFADKELFSGKLFVSTPAAQTSAQALNYVEGVWQALGCRVERMTPEDHDNIFAAVSHLPHLLAFALVGHVVANPSAARMLEAAGSGFRDFTRIAASSPSMWRDICLANNAAIARELAVYRERIDTLQKAILLKDARTIEHVLEAASQSLLRTVAHR